MDNVTTMRAQPTPMSGEQQRWLATLYEGNFAAVFKRCRAILKSEEDAADTAHEVFLIALNSLAPDTDEKRARAWLLTVAHNHCLDLLRRRQRFGRALLTLGADQDARGDLEAGVVDRDYVDGLLRQLSLRERLALWQSAVEHRSLADIAAGLQLSYAAAAQVVHRARQHASRLAAGAAAILTVLRFPRRALARVAAFRTDAQQLLAAHRLTVLATLPVVAVLSLQSSTAGSTSPAVKAAMATPATASIPGSLSAPGGLGALLAPLTGASGPQGIAGSAGLSAPGGIPSAVTPTLKSLTDRVQQSVGQLSLPPAPTLPPTPSLPPIGH